MSCTPVSNPSAHEVQTELWHLPVLCILVSALSSLKFIAKYLYLTLRVKVFWSCISNDFLFHCKVEYELLKFLDFFFFLQIYFIYFCVPWVYEKKNKCALIYLFIHSFLSFSFFLSFFILNDKKTSLVQLFISSTSKPEQGHDCKQSTSNLFCLKFD